MSYFKSAHLRATEVQKRCTVFFEGEWTSANVYNYCLIIAENSDEDIQVTFYLTDAHEMNWITEFIDSPFFTGHEKQAAARPVGGLKVTCGHFIDQRTAMYLSYKEGNRWNEKDSSGDWQR